MRRTVLTVAGEVARGRRVSYAIIKRVFMLQYGQILIE